MDIICNVSIPDGCQIFKMAAKIYFFKQNKRRVSDRTEYVYEFKLILCKLVIQWHTMCKLSIQDGR